MIRQEALAQGFRTFLGKSCRHGHPGRRRTRQGDCVECRNAHQRAARARTVRFSLRVPADLYAAAHEYAERNEMSMEDLALLACRIVNQAAAQPPLPAF